MRTMTRRGVSSGILEERGSKASRLNAPAREPTLSIFASRSSLRCASSAKALRHGCQFQYGGLQQAESARAIGHHLGALWIRPSVFQRRKAAGTRSTRVDGRAFDTHLPPVLKGRIMRKPLIAALLVSALGVAAAQTTVTTPTPTPTPAPVTTPNTPSPKVAADKTVTQGERTELRADRSATEAERAQLKADKAAGNTAAMKTDKQALRHDKHAKAHDKAQVEADHAATHEQRGETKEHAAKK
jgi:hypothetical protein